MCISKMSAVKGAVIGTVAGMVVGMGVKSLMDTNKRTLKRKANKMVDAVENLADTAKNMFT